MTESIHGHEVIAMMAGNSYTEESLLAAIREKFGEDARFHTCSASDMTASELIAFLRARGKFMPSDGGFAFDPAKRCSHS